MDTPFSISGFYAANEMPINIVIAVILLFVIYKYYTTYIATSTAVVSGMQSSQLGGNGSALLISSATPYGGQSRFLTSSSDLATQFVPPGIKYSNPDVKSFVTNLTMDPTQALANSTPLPASVVNSNTVPTNITPSAASASTTVASPYLRRPNILSNMNSTLPSHFLSNFISAR